MTADLSTMTPWGETYDALAHAVLADKSAPPQLLLAAFVHIKGEPRPLRSMIAEAVALTSSFDLPRNSGEVAAVNGPTTVEEKDDASAPV